MADHDPFRGIKLSEQAPSNRVEQRLFAEPIKSRAVEPQSVVDQPFRPVKQSPSVLKSSEPAPARSVDLRPASLVHTTFNLDDEALYKASYVFTSQELEALEDLKLELKRELDSKVTKNDLMRAALHLLIEDYRDNPNKSFIRRKIKKH